MTAPRRKELLMWQAAEYLGIELALLEAWRTDGRLDGLEGVPARSSSNTELLISEETVRTIGLAFGLLDPDTGQRYETTPVKRGSWSSPKPTVCPSGPRKGEKRYYLDHLAVIFGVKKQPTLHAWIKRGVLEPPQFDELSRPFWFMDMVERVNRPITGSV